MFSLSNVIVFLWLFPVVLLIILPLLLFVIQMGRVSFRKLIERNTRRVPAGVTYSLK